MANSNHPEQGSSKPYSAPQKSTQGTALSKAVSVRTLQQHKQQQQKFSCISLYDATLAALAEQQGVETVLIGDSLGMTIQGHSSTLPVTMEHMIYHTEAVCRGNHKSLIIADLPFMAYSTPEQAMVNSALLMQAGAHMVKLEGGAWLEDTVYSLSERGVPVCAHLGLTPQSVNKFGGYRVQGRDQQQAKTILDDAKTLSQAGADCVLLECIPAELAKKMTLAIDVPTIGIGAGKDTDAQVLVINDMIGLTPTPPKFSKNFLLENNSIAAAVAQYNNDVKAGIFPAEEHTF